MGLERFHRRLAALRRRRQGLRLATALLAVIAAVGLLLLALMGIDVALSMTVAQRVVLLGIAVMVLFWAARRYALPWLRRPESELELALLVEHEQRIDSDLVAALQFERAEAAAWGSRQLEEAVVAEVADKGEKIDVKRGLSYREFGRRAGVVAIAAAVWTGLALLLPDYVSAFFQRLALGPQHYPTRTRLLAIEVNQQSVDPVWPAASKVVVSFGQTARFRVEAGGELPEQGRVELVARGGQRTRIALERSGSDANIFEAQWPRALDSVEYQVFLGDAWTDAASLSVVPPPHVDMEITVVPPSYAGGGQPATLPAGLRQASVIEGSQVIVRITSDKDLRDAALTIGGETYAFRREGTSNGHDRWSLADGDSPLRAVRESLRFTVQATDLHGQQLERPLDGLIRIQADALPRIAAATIHKSVLPAAKPTIHYRAIDDYGIARITALQEVTHADGQTSQQEATVYQLGERRASRDVADSYALDLAPLKLVKGDSVRVTFRAEDYRGAAPGKIGSAEPLVFQVTDEQGILAGMLEADKQSAGQLRTMIQRQLGIGDSP